MIVDLQLKNNDCGISVIKTIFNKYRIPIDKQYIQQHVFLDQNGSRLTDIKSFFIAHDFDARFEVLDINYLHSNTQLLKQYMPFIIPVKVKDSNGLHYVIVNSIKRKKLEILDPSKLNPYYVTLQELKSMAHFSSSYWEMVTLDERLSVLCNDELQNYNIKLDAALAKNSHADLFNKLTYFSYIKENFSFKNADTERDFLLDLINNQEVSRLPKHFRSVKYENDKVKIKAPLVLTVKPPEKKAINNIQSTDGKDRNIYVKLFKKLGDNKSLWYKYIFAAIFSAITTYLAIFTNQILLDYVLPSNQMSTLIIFVIGLGIFRLFDMSTSVYKAFIGIHVSNMLDKYFLVSFDRKINNSSLSYIHTFRKADLTERLGDALKLKAFFMRTCTNLLIDGFIGLYSLAVLFYFNWQLTTIICIVIALFVIWYMIITPYVRQNERIRFLLKADFFSKMLEKLDGVQVLKSFNMERVYSVKLYTSIKDLLNIQIKNRYISLLNSSFVSVVSIGASLAIVVILGREIIVDNTMTVGQMITFTALSSRIFSSLSSLLSENINIQENTVILKRYLDFEEQGDAINNISGIDEFEIQSLKLEHVSFEYIPGKKILNNIDFDLKKGDIIKIEGTNGSGKSTLSKIVTGLYNPTSGVYMINDVKSDFYTSQKIRDKLLLVTNEDILFNDSIVYNITFGKKVSVSKIIELAKKIQFYDFLASKEEGLDFVISENGKNLSTGQRKKILLLRALFSDAEIVILDEVLSGMDAQSRFDVEGLLNEIKEKTFIIISHEETANVNFSKKYLINHGELRLCQPEYSEIN